MKMMLMICGDSVEEIQKGLDELSKIRLESECIRFTENFSYNYDFSGSDDLFSEDRAYIVVDPNVELPNINASNKEKIMSEEKTNQWSVLDVRKQVDRITGDLHKAFQTMDFNMVEGLLDELKKLAEATIHATMSFTAGPRRNVFIPMPEKENNVC